MRQPRDGSNQARGQRNSAQRLNWAAYAACAWSLSFAAMSFYWAAGGTLGTEMLGEAFLDPAVRRDPAFVAFVWATGVLKLLPGLLALALVRPWGQLIPRWVLLVGVWAIGVVLTLYGVALLIQHTLMLVGVLDTSTSLGEKALPWHIALWDPFWTLGGVLFLIAARSFHRQNPGPVRG